ncbi:MAG: preprotein translocase subunit SecY [Clostridiales bacterium]|nr:preprotein translocase subunit SecY [Clostridiales bacterium]
MFKTIGKAWNIPDIRKKIVFTLLMLVVFRIGSNIPVPGINREILDEAFSGDSGLFELFDLFSGGAFSNLTIFALSITPYITASIVLQLLTIAIPALERMSKEGVEGRKKITRYTRYFTVVLAFVQAVGMTLGIFRQYLISTDAFHIITVIFVLSAGTAFLMWLGELINEHGIGNGISLIIFGGIVARVPSAAINSISNVKSGTISFVNICLFIAFAILVIVVIIEIQQGQRRIPVQYAKRVVGRKSYGGQASHIPIKVNQAGVIPVIFGMSLLQLPQTLVYFWPNSGFAEGVSKWLSTNGAPGTYVYSILYAILIIFFTYFYTSITFNPEEVSENMKSNGGFIPGIRPGKPTVEYLQKVMNRVTFTGAVFLAVIAVMPIVIGNFTAIDFRFGGTSLLIAVGVALDTMKQLENQMVMRNYHGFLK